MAAELQSAVLADIFQRSVLLSDVSSTADNVIHQLPPPNLIKRTSSSWNDPDIANIRTIIKRLYDDTRIMYRDDGGAHATALTLTDVTGDISYHLSHDYEVECLSTVWMSVFEQLHKSGVVSTQDTSCTSLHLSCYSADCLSAVNHYINQTTSSDGSKIKWKWRSLSYNTSHEYLAPIGVPDLYTDVPLHQHDVWTYGRDNTGDITKISNIQSVWDVYRIDKSSPSLITCHGDLYNDNITEIYNVLHNMMTCSLGCLSRGGSMMMVMPMVGDEPCVSMLYLLCCCFANVTLTPLMSLPCSESEHFNIITTCVGYRGIKKEYMSGLMAAGPTGCALIPRSSISPQFMDSLRKCFESITNWYCQLSRYSMAHVDVEMTKLTNIKSEIWNKFKSICPVLRLSTSNRLLMAAFDTSSGDLSTIPHEKNVHDDLEEGEVPEAEPEPNTTYIPIYTTSRCRSRMQIAPPPPPSVDLATLVNQLFDRSVYQPIEAVFSPESSIGYPAFKSFGSLSPKTLVEVTGEHPTQLKQSLFLSLANNSRLTSIYDNYRALDHVESNRTSRFTTTTAYLSGSPLDVCDPRRLTSRWPNDFDITSQSSTSISIAAAHTVIVTPAFRHVSNVLDLSADGAVSVLMGSTDVKRMNRSDVIRLLNTVITDCCFAKRREKPEVIKAINDSIRSLSNSNSRFSLVIADACHYINVDVHAVKSQKLPPVFHEIDRRYRINLLYQLAISMINVASGGSVVIRMSTAITRFGVGIVWMMSKCFGSVICVRSPASPLLSDEMFMFCSNCNDTVRSIVINHLVHTLCRELRILTAVNQHEGTISLTGFGVMECVDMRCLLADTAFLSAVSLFNDGILEIIDNVLYTTVKNNK